MFVLLDQIGWRATPTATPVQIDLREHQKALVRTLEVMLTIADNELANLETRRAMHHKPSICETTISRIHAQHEFATAIKEISP